MLARLNSDTREQSRGGGGGIVHKRTWHYERNVKQCPPRNARDESDCCCVAPCVAAQALNGLFPHLKISFLPLDLLDEKTLEVAIVSFAPDYILHLASSSSVAQSWSDPISSFMNNTNIFLNVAQAVYKNKINCRILSVGSSEEYGNVAAENLPLKEEMPLSPVSPYAIARVSQEMLSKCYVKSMGLDIVLTRSFNHIGPGQRDIFVIPSFIKQITDGKKALKSEVVLKTGDIDIVRDFTDVRDVVRAYYLLLHKGERGELYNVCSGRGIKLRDCIALIAQKAGVKVNNPNFPRLVRPSDNRVTIGNNEKIKAQTGWQTEHSFESTVSDIIDEYMKKGE